MGVYTAFYVEYFRRYTNPPKKISDTWNKLLILLGPEQIEFVMNVNVSLRPPRQPWGESPAGRFTHVFYGFVTRWNPRQAAQALFPVKRDVCQKSAGSRQRWPPIKMCFKTEQKKYLSSLYGSMLCYSELASDNLVQVLLTLLEMSNNGLEF